MGPSLNAKPLKSQYVSKQIKNGNKFWDGRDFLNRIKSINR